MGPRSRIANDTSDPDSPEMISPPPLTEAIIGAGLVYRRLRHGRPERGQGRCSKSWSVARETVSFVARVVGRRRLARCGTHARQCAPSPRIRACATRYSIRGLRNATRIQGGIVIQEAPERFGLREEQTLDYMRWIFFALIAVVIVERAEAKVNYTCHEDMILHLYVMPRSSHAPIQP